MAVANTATSALIRRADLALPTPYVAPSGELETFIAKLFAEVLTLDHVGADDDFIELGGDSLLGEVLSMRISERTGFEIPLLGEHDSPRRIVEVLRSKGIVSPSYPARRAGNDVGGLVKIVCLEQGKDHTPLYCMPTISGSVSAYVELAKLLGGDRPVFGIQIADQEQTGKLGAFASVEEIAASMVAKLSTHHRDGPICLIGYSFGGYLAVEVAKQLVGHDKLVPFVGVIDTTPGPACFARTQLIHHLARNVGPWALNFASWALKVMTREITEARHWVTVRNVILRKFRGQQKMHHVMRNDWYKNLPEGRKNIVAQNLLHARKYRFEGIYRGTISLFRQRPSAPPFDHLFRPHQLDDYGWRGVTRANVQVVYICGDHSSCMVPPDVVHLANELSLALDVAIAAPEAERAL